MTEKRDTYNVYVGPQNGDDEATPATPGSGKTAIGVGWAKVGDPNGDQKLVTGGASPQLNSGGPATLDLCWKADVLALEIATRLARHPDDHTFFRFTTPEMSAQDRINGVIHALSQRGHRESLAELSEVVCEELGEQVAPATRPSRSSRNDRAAARHGDGAVARVTLRHKLLGKIPAPLSRGSTRLKSGAVRVENDGLTYASDGVLIVNGVRAESRRPSVR